MSDVHDCPHCECDQCARCDAHITGEPYTVELEYYSNNGMYSKGGAIGRTSYDTGLCKSCASDLKSVTLDFIRGKLEADDE